MGADNIPITNEYINKLLQEAADAGWNFGGTAGEDEETAGFMCDCDECRCDTPDPMAAEGSGFSLEDFTKQSFGFEPIEVGVTKVDGGFAIRQWGRDGNMYRQFVRTNLAGVNEALQQVFID